MTRPNVTFDLLVNGKQALSGLKQFQAQIKTFATEVSRHIKRAAVAFVGLAGLSLRNYALQEAAEAKLAGVLRATGSAAGFSADELKKMAADLQVLTRFGDEATISAQAILLTFKQVRGVNFRDALESAMDLSVVLGQDLRSATVMLGKALNDPIQGLTAMTRAGISFSEQQKDQIRAMVKAGKVADAQRLILRELKDEFGGVARELGESADWFEQLKGTLGDLTEKIGAKIVPQMREFSDVLKYLAQHLKAEMIVSVGKWTIALGAALVVIPKVISIVKALVVVFQGLAKAQATAWALSGPKGWAVLAASIGVAAAGVYKLNSMYREMARAAKRAGEEARKAAEAALAKPISEPVRPFGAAENWNQPDAQEAPVATGAETRPEIIPETILQIQRQIAAAETSLEEAERGVREASDYSVRMAEAFVKGPFRIREGGPERLPEEERQKGESWGAYVKRRWETEKLPLEAELEKAVMIAASWKKRVEELKQMEEAERRAISEERTGRELLAQARRDLWKAEAQQLEEQKQQQAGIKSAIQAAWEQARAERQTAEASGFSARMESLQQTYARIQAAAASKPVAKADHTKTIAERVKELLTDERKRNQEWKQFIGNQMDKLSPLLAGVGALR